MLCNALCFMLVNLILMKVSILDFLLIVTGIELETSTIFYNDENVFPTLAIISLQLFFVVQLYMPLMWVLIVVYISKYVLMGYHRDITKIINHFN